MRVLPFNLCTSTSARWPPLCNKVVLYNSLVLHKFIGVAQTKLVSTIFITLHSSASTTGAQEDPHELLIQFLTLYGELATEIFGAEFTTTVTCETCSRKFHMRESAPIVSVSIDDKRSLLDALLAHTQPEALAGQNQFLCTHCKEKTNATKQTRISAQPKTLVPCASCPMLCPLL